MMEDFQLAKVKHAKPWSVQLATGAKRKVTQFIANCEVKIQDHVARINLNILPLGLYYMIIGMDWLENYKLILNCFDKTFTYVVDDQIVRKIGGISKLVSLRQISTMQLKRCMRKCCKFYAVRVTNLLLNEDQTHIKDYTVLSEFRDVFPEEIPGYLLNEKYISP